MTPEEVDALEAVKGIRKSLRGTVDAIERAHASAWEHEDELFSLISALFDAKLAIDKVIAQCSLDRYRLEGEE